MSVAGRRAAALLLAVLAAALMFYGVFATGGRTWVLTLPQ